VTKQLNAEKILLHKGHFIFILFLMSPPLSPIPSPFAHCPLIVILVVVILFMAFPFIYNPLSVMVRKKGRKAGTSVLIFGSGEKGKPSAQPHRYR
jgi:hypothetical protein